MVSRRSSKQGAVQGVPPIGIVGSGVFGQEAAQKTIDQVQFSQLSVADQEAFASALIAPPKPNAALKRGFKRRKQLLSNV